MRSLASLVALAAAGALAVIVAGRLDAPPSRRARSPALLSEHAIGHAVDVARFFARGGARISVERAFGGALAGPAADFVRRVAARSRHADGVVHLLGPWSDADHRDHLHIDGAAAVAAPPRPLS